MKRSLLVLVAVWGLTAGALDALAQGHDFDMPIVSEGISNSFHWRFVRRQSHNVSLYRVSFNNHVCKGTMTKVDNVMAWKIEDCTNGGSCIGFGDATRGYASGMYQCGVPYKNTFRVNDFFGLGGSRDLSID